MRRDAVRGERLRLDDGDVGAGETDLPKKLRALVQIELEVDDLDALYQRFLQAGNPVPVPPRDRGFERSMQCRDPDGFTIEFAQGERGHNATDPDYWNKPQRTRREG